MAVVGDNRGGMLGEGCYGMWCAESEDYVCSEREIRERNSIGSCEKSYLRENERSLARVEEVNLKRRRDLAWT